MSAVVYDQSGMPLNPQPALTWLDNTGEGINHGLISQTGLFTAGSTALTESIYVYAAGSGFGVYGNINITVSSGPVLSFSVPTAVVAENAGSITLSVRRQGSNSGAVSCNYKTSGGSVNNYLPTSGTLTWADGDTSDKTISITIKDDNQGGPNPPFTVSLSAPLTGGAQLGTWNSEVVTVTDVDGLNLPGVLQFISASEGVNKTVGTAKLDVTRTKGSHGAVSVNYQTADGTALAGSNYTTTSGTINWANGDVATKTITVPILNSASQSSDVSFTLMLSSPAIGGASVGVPSSTTITIVNNNGGAPPTITTNPAATPNPVTLPASTQLSVVATDPNNKTLTYTWRKLSGPGNVTFGSNGTVASNNSSATFDAAGSLFFARHNLQWVGQHHR